MAIKKEPTLSEKIAIKYVTSDNRTIVLSETNGLEETLSPFERKRDLRESLTLYAIILTLLCYLVLTVLQFQANEINRRGNAMAREPWITLSVRFEDIPNSDFNLYLEFENASDNPAENFEYAVVMASKDRFDRANEKSRFHDRMKKAFDTNGGPQAPIFLIPPHQKFFQSTFNNKRDSVDSDKIYSQLKSGERLIWVIYRANSVYGDTIYSECVYSIKGSSLDLLYSDAMVIDAK